MQELISELRGSSVMQRRTMETLHAISGMLESLKSNNIITDTTNNKAAVRKRFEVRKSMTTHDIGPNEKVEKGV